MGPGVLCAFVCAAVSRISCVLCIRVCGCLTYLSTTVCPVCGACHVSVRGHASHAVRFLGAWVAFAVWGARVDSGAVSAAVTVGTWLSVGSCFPWYSGAHSM